MEEIIKELEKFGYEGNIGKGCTGSKDNMRNYAHIQFIKKGNSNLIKKLIANGWEKEVEFKLSNHFETKYSGYSMCVRFRKYY